MAINAGDLYWLAPDEDPSRPSTVLHPHVVVSDDVFNHSRITTVVVCALTTNLHKAKEPGNVLLDDGEGALPQRSVIVVSQVASVPKASLGDRIGALSSSRVAEAVAGLRFVQRLSR